MMMIPAFLELRVGSVRLPTRLPLVLVIQVLGARLILYEILNVQCCEVGRSDGNVGGRIDVLLATMVS